jgi:hypothetical protein
LDRRTEEFKKSKESLPTSSRGKQELPLEELKGDSLELSQHEPLSHFSDAGEQETETFLPEQDGNPIANISNSEILDESNAPSIPKDYIWEDKANYNEILVELDQDANFGHIVKNIVQ